MTRSTSTHASLRSRRCREIVPAPLLGALGLLVGSAAEAAVVPATIVVAEGDMPPGASAPISSINAPFVEGAGVVAFSGSLGGSESYIFRGDQVIWRNGLDMTVTLSGAEPTMGTAPNGSFIYSPSVDNADAVYTHNGPLALDGQQAPDLPAGVDLTFNSRPSMNDTGAAYWVAGINAAGGTTTLERVLYRSATGSFGDSEVVLQGGDVVDGLVIDPVGIGFGYQTSHDDQHLIIDLTIDGQPTASDGFVYVDGVAVAVEGSPTGDGDLWANFDLFAIDSAGNYIFTGDTDGATTTDEFIAYNGQIALREGGVVDGITLTSSATVGMASLNDVGQAAFVWNVSGGTEIAFLSCDAASLASDARALLSTGDELDLDGDGTGDGLFVDDFLASTGANSRALADDGSIHLELDLTDGATVFEAIVRLEGTCCGDGIVQGSEECDDSNPDPGDGCSATCEIESLTCGDGVTDAGEDCDDGNADDTDACLGDCTAASCGDGVTWAGTEECDDGNTDDSDECTNDCMFGAVGSSSSGGGESSGGESTDGGESTGGEATTDGGADTSGGAASTGGEDTTGGGIDGSTGGGIDGSTGGGTGDSTGDGGPLPGDTAPVDSTGTMPDTDTDGAGQSADDGCGCTTEPNPTRGIAGTFAMLLLGAGLRRRR